MIRLIYGLERIKRFFVEAYWRIRQEREVRYLGLENKGLKSIVDGLKEERNNLESDKKKLEEKSTRLGEVCKGYLARLNQCYAKLGDLGERLDCAIKSNMLLQRSSSEVVRRNLELEGLVLGLQAELAGKYKETCSDYSKSPGIDLKALLHLFPKDSTIPISQREHNNREHHNQKNREFVEFRKQIVALPWIKAIACVEEQYDSRNHETQYLILPNGKIKMAVPFGGNVRYFCLIETTAENDLQRALVAEVIKQHHKKHYGSRERK